MTFQPLFNNPHLQTIAGAWLREGTIRSRRERSVRIPSSQGDELLGTWEVAPGDRLLVVVHGLGGSRHAGHGRSLGRIWRKRGLGPVLRLGLRGSEQIPEVPRLYHGGSWEDLEACWNWLGDWGPCSIWVGLSLGANILVQWLGRSGRLPAAAVSVCNPWNLRACAEHLETSWWGRNYRRRLVERLKPRALQICRRFPGSMDEQRILNATTFAEYDLAVTVPLHPFTDLNDYYDSASSDQYLEKVRSPLLCLDALDDPLVNARPRTRQAHIDHELTPLGGHLGFLGSAPLFWMEERIADWAQRRLGRSRIVMVT